jgi:hypothetical protein
MHSGDVMGRVHLSDSAHVALFFCFMPTVPLHTYCNYPGFSLPDTHLEFLYNLNLAPPTPCAFLTIRPHTVAHLKRGCSTVGEGEVY